MTDNDYLAWLILRTNPPSIRMSRWAELLVTNCNSCGEEQPVTAMAGDPARCAACLLRVADDIAVTAGQLVCERDAARVEASDLRIALGRAEGWLEGLQARYDTLGRTLQAAVAEKEAAQRMVDEMRAKG